MQIINIYFQSNSWEKMRWEESERDISLSFVGWKFFIDIFGSFFIFFSQQNKVQFYVWSSSEKAAAEEDVKAVNSLGVTETITGRGAATYKGVLVCFFESDYSRGFFLKWL